jgi:RimJ/RimL family protein N-acetyltransferase
MFLQTERLFLRPFALSDVDVLAPILGNPEVMRFSLNGPLNKEQVKEYLQKRILDHYEKYGYGMYAVLLKENSQLIGFVGLIHQMIEGEEKVELGFRLDPAFWGKGYATEAAKVVVCWAFDQLGLDQIISIIDPQNTASLQVAARLQMHLLKKSLFHGFSVEIYALNKVKRSSS